MVFYRPQFGRPGHTTTDLDSSTSTKTMTQPTHQRHQGHPGSPGSNRGGGGVARYLFHPIWMKTSISLGLTALALLLLVMVLLSVPGPIKGLYWFSVKGEEGGSISAGVLGWCSESPIFHPLPTPGFVTPRRQIFNDAPRYDD
jgi:hypothetical protein